MRRNGARHPQMAAPNLQVEALFFEDTVNGFIYLPINGTKTREDSSKGRQRYKPNWRNRMKELVRNPIVWLLVGLILGSGIGVGTTLAISAATATEEAYVTVFEGTITSVNADGTKISFEPAGNPEDVRAYSLVGAWWRDGDVNNAAWKSDPTPEGHPTCVVPLSRGQDARIGLVSAMSDGSAPGIDVVVWVECLGEPAGFSG